MKTLNGLALFAVLGLAACGARSNPSMPARDSGPRADRYQPPPRPDYGVPPYPDYGIWDTYQPIPDSYWWPDAPHWWPDAGGCSAEINSSCQYDSDCCGNLLCVGLESGLRVCSRRCTPDNPETPLTNEDNCPNNWELSCANIAGPYGGESYYCLRRCKPQLYNNPCPDGIACHPKDNQIDYDLQTSSCARPMCKDNRDCPVFLSKTCFSDQDCPASYFCAEDDSASAFGGLAQRRCATQGLCEQASGLCRPASLAYKNGRIGDPCTDDLQCSRGMRCVFEIVDASGLAYARNGYCAIEGCVFADNIDHLRCPVGSSCQRLFPGGVCYRSCEASDASTCRGFDNDSYADYECYDWSFLYLAGLDSPVADGPTCEPAIYPCDFFAGWADCSIIAEPGNAQNMRCRDPFSGQTLPEGSIGGVCLDDSASGTP